MDVNTTFLNGHLFEDVYKAQTEGFQNAKYPDKVCKLYKFICGLKQASCNWKLKFDEKIKEYSFDHSKEEPCFFIRIRGYKEFFLTFICR